MVSMAAVKDEHLQIIILTSQVTGTSKQVQLSGFLLQTRSESTSRNFGQKSDVSHFVLMSLCLYGYPLKDSEIRYTFYFVGFEHLFACPKDTPPVMHLFNVNSGNTRTICEIYNLKVTK